MARRRNDSFERDLRRFARAARWDKVRVLLEQRLHRQPNDEEARQELDRLNQGLSLRALESPLERQRRQAREMREELAAELELYQSTPHLPTTWDTPLLRQRVRRVGSIRSLLGRQLPEEMSRATADYLATLQQELKRRLLRRHRTLGLITVPILLALGLGTGLLFYQRTLRLDEALVAALSTGEARAVEQAANVADSGINRLVNPKLAGRIVQARDWLDRSRRLHSYLAGIIAGIESGRGSVAGLPMAHRADIARSLRQLPRDNPDLPQRWQKLCNHEKEQLRQQADSVQGLFAAPLPPLPTPSGKLTEDDKLLRALKQQLTQRLRDFAIAQEAYGLSPSLMDSTHARLEELDWQLADIAAMRHTAVSLPAARSYNHYRRLLEQNKPRAYAPALSMLEILKQLPTEEELRDQMQDKNRKLPPGMLEAVRHALLEGGPSFTPSFHANDLQVSLMEDIFTSRALRTKLYELSCEGEQSWLTESPPEVRDKRLHFSPSSYDPKYDINTPRTIVWDNPKLALIRPIDPAPLLSRLEVERSSFFRDRNLPQLLDRLMEPRPQHCPALAQAYLYNRLRAVMQEHDWPRMLGLPYAPTLRADFRSFSQLEKQLGFEATSGCWLTPGPARDEAEKAFAQWFREREGRAYAAEIARNFGSLVGLRPRFVGYIDESGNARLCIPVAEGKLLWYISHGGVTATPQGEAMEEPSLLSPLFVIEKD